ncbi:MAG: SGNH/GDSL hydrolase family protein [Acidimicrobiia bacterium]|nr:SGNH/GDSL hydrolase family protein [Acidimicrobiia bacterium]
MNAGTRVRAVFVVAALLLLSLPLPAQQSGDHWVGTWATADVARPQTPPAPPAAPPGAQPAPQPPPFMHVTNQTLRQVARVSIGGRRVRVVVSNAYGTAPLTIGAAHIALRGTDSSIAAGGRPLTFSGQPTMAIPAGAILVSDAVDLAVAPMADVAVDLYLPGTTNTPSPLAVHNAGLQTNYVSGTGNFTGAATFPTVATLQNYIVLAGMHVTAPETMGAIVTFGDSITDGARSTPDTNNRWPNILAQRLLSSPRPLAVLNAGISGNRVLSEGAPNAGINALARFERHVLSQPGVTHVVVLEGINDIGIAGNNPTPTADDLIAGHKQLIARAHARGLTIIGATLTPFEGAGYFTQTGEAKRQALNRWIRTGGAYDGVIDFDAATRDPNDPTRFLSQYDSGDKLHPGDAGYRAMAEAVDLALFANRRAAASVSSR